MVRSRRSTALGSGSEHSTDGTARVSLRLDSAVHFEPEVRRSPNDKFRRRVSLPRRVAWHRERLHLILQRQGLHWMSAWAFFVASFGMVWVARTAFSNRPFAAEDPRRPMIAHHGYIRPTYSGESSVPVKLPSLVILHESIESPPELSELDKEQAASRDWGGLQLRFLHEENASRVLYRENHSTLSHSGNDEDDEDHIDSYYAYDDDHMRSPYTRFDDDAVKDWRNVRTCRRTSWHRLTFPTCNRLHEMDPPRKTPRYLNAGAYRQVFVYLDSEEEIIWKQLSFAHSPDYEYFEYIRMDALVSERLTSSPSIVDIYGYCGNSILSEYVHDGDLEALATPRGGFISSTKLKKHYKLHGGVSPLNDISVHDKLRMALDMAESIAWLHGFPDGLMVHDDIQLGQFLVTSHGSIKLNDFNRAEIMLWDEENREYCRYFNGEGAGEHRSPEEYRDDPVDENIDTYSLGNIIYVLMTGLHPFFDSDDEDELHERVKDRNEQPFVDPVYRNGTFAERKLVEIMERCFAYDPWERPSMFEIVSFLRDAVQSDKAHHT